MLLVVVVLLVGSAASRCAVSCCGAAVVLLVVQARAKGNTDVVDCVERKVPLIEKQTKGAWSAVTQCSNQADAVWVMLSTARAADRASSLKWEMLKPSVVTKLRWSQLLSASLWRLAWVCTFVGGLCLRSGAKASSVDKFL